MQLNTACGNTLTTNEQFLAHMAGHSSVTEQMLIDGIKQVTIDSTKTAWQMATVDLGYQTGYSGLIVLKQPVGMDEQIWFGFRGTDRQAPSPIAKGHPGFPTNYLTIGFKLVEYVWTLVTAYPSNPEDPNPGPEPITLMHSPDKNANWQELRDAALEKWRGLQLAEGPADLRGDPFLSTWNKIMEKYGNVYH